MSLVHGPELGYDIPKEDIYSHVFKDIAIHGDKVALVNAVTGKEITYSQLIEYVECLAGGLRQLGVDKGSMVCIYSFNSVEYVIVFWAVQKLGAILTTTNSTYTFEELSHQLSDSEASIIFAPPELVANVQKAQQSLGNRSNLRHVIVIGESNEYRTLDVLVRSGKGALAATRTPSSHEVALLPYSSGTTGLSKGVLITHANVLAALAISDHVYKDDMSGVCLGYLPLYHIYGMICLMVRSMARRLAFVVVPEFKPHHFCSTLQRYKFSVLQIVPPTLVFLAKSEIPQRYDLSSIKVIYCGAAPIGAQTERAVTAKYGATVKQCWGMTETTGFGTMPVQNGKVGSIGKVPPACSMKIVDPDTGLVCEHNQPGEIWYKSPLVMNGYHKNPEATALTVTADGWLKTGDLGYIDDEGFIYATDRLKELIKYKGFQVPPAELEQLLLSHPSVGDAAVIGVPDEAAGELPAAFVVLKPDHPVTAEQLHAFVREHVSKNKWLYGGISFVTTIPKSPSGKILRRKLRTLAVRAKL